MTKGAPKKVSEILKEMPRQWGSDRYPIFKDGKVVGQRIHIKFDKNEFNDWLTRLKQAMKREGVDIG